MRRKSAKTHHSRFNITLVFVVISIVISLLSLWFGVRLINNAEDEIHHDLQIEMVNLERSLSDKIDHTFSIIKNINSQIAENPTNKKHINDILKRYRTSPSLNESFAWTIFSWSNTDFQLTVDAQYGIMDKPYDLSTRDYISLTEKEPNIFHLGSPIIGSTSRKWMIPGGVGTTDENGKYLGTMTIGFEIGALAKLLHNIVQNPNVTFSLFNKNEVAILHGDIKNSNIDKISDDSSFNLATSKVLNKINSKQSEEVFSISLFGNRHAFLAKKVANYPFILFLRYDKHAIGSSFWNLVQSRTIELLSISLGLTILLILIYREKRQTLKILELQQYAEHANQTKSEFLSQSIHEFKNFIFGIQGCTEIIKNDLKILISTFTKDGMLHNKRDLHELETDFNLSEEIIEATNNLSVFINDLTDLNCAESGDFKIIKSPKPTNIENIIKQSVKLMLKKAKNYDITLVAKIEDHLHKPIDVDPKRIKQVITNLISHAIKHSPPDTVVEIFARNVADKVEIKIQDQGFGMNEREIKAALKKYQTMKSNAKKLDSVGLELPILKYLVEAQGGIFEIKSERGIGTEVKIIF